MTDPERELEEFLASKPVGFRKWMERDYSYTRDEQRTLWLSASIQERGEWEDQYRLLLQRIPAKWKKYKKMIEKEAVVRLPTSKRGRPRKDALAEEAIKLRSQDHSYGQVEQRLKAEGMEVASKESIRKLINSRKPKHPGQK